MKNIGKKAYASILDKLVGLYVLVILVAILIPLTFTEIAGTNTSDFPSGTEALWTNVFPILIILGVVLSAYGYVKFKKMG